MGWLLGVSAFRGDIETNQGLPSTRNSRDKTYHFPVLQARLVDKFFNAPGSHAQVAGTGIVSRDGVNRMLRIEILCRLDERRRVLLPRQSHRGPLRLHLLVQRLHMSLGRLEVGPRLVEQTIRQKLPKGFQTAESLLEHGMIDDIVPRDALKARLATLIDYLAPRAAQAGEAS